MLLLFLVIPLRCEKQTEGLKAEKTVTFNRKPKKMNNSTLFSTLSMLLVIYYSPSQVIYSISVARDVEVS